MALTNLSQYGNVLTCYATNFHCTNGNTSVSLSPRICIVANSSISHYKEKNKEPNSWSRARERASFLRPLCNPFRWNGKECFSEQCSFPLTCNGKRPNNFMLCCVSCLGASADRRRIFFPCHLSVLCFHQTDELLLIFGRVSHFPSACSADVKEV